MQGGGARQSACIVVPAVLPGLRMAVEVLGQVGAGEFDEDGELQGHLPEVKVCRRVCLLSDSATRLCPIENRGMGWHKPSPGLVQRPNFFNSRTHFAFWLSRRWISDSTIV